MYWMRPTNFVESADWSDEANAYDGDVTSFAYTSTEDSFVEMTFPWGVLASKIRYWVGNDIEEVDVDIWDGDSWEHVFDGAITLTQQYEEKELSAPTTISKIRIAFRWSAPAPKNLYEISAYVYDPFTHALIGLWDLLEAEPEIVEMVSTRNRIKLYEGTKRPKEKTKYSITDLPEIKIEPMGSAFNPAASSSSAQLTQTYRIMLMDGNLRLHETYFPLKWAIFRALASIDATLGLDFVRRVTVEDGTDERNVIDHPGWNAGIDIVVEMWFNRTDIKT